MTQDDQWTIGRLLTWTTDYLTKHGAESPRLDAEVLLAEARGCERIDLYVAFDEVASDKVRTAFRELVRRRAEHMPVAYLVGHKEFYSMPFRVTPEVLIPRPETEFLVIGLLDQIKDMGELNRPVEVIDVGTGSGVIAVCAAKHAKNCRVTAVDISKPALEIAHANAREHGIEDRIEFLHSDLFSSVPADRRFDFVVSNPPYVSESEGESLLPEVKNHEPRRALIAGPTGTEVIARLIPSAAERLRPRGRFLCEVSPVIEPRVRELIAQDSRFDASTTIKDLAGLPRVVNAQQRVD